jgi:hypothetical protein
MSGLAFSDKEYQEFNIFFNARNGTWIQKLRLRNIQGEWKMANWVWRTALSTSNNPLFQKIDPKFQGDRTILILTRNLR